MSYYQNTRSFIAKVFLFVVIVLVLMLFDTQIQAEPWQDLIQPKGYLVRLWTAVGTPPGPPLPTPSLTPPVPGVNNICYQWDTTEVPGVTDPFDNGTLITEIQPTELVHLVRVYNAAAGSTKGGAWMMFPQSLRGLTAAQIRDVFALPTVPDTIVTVDIPPSQTIYPEPGTKYGLWTGIAAPIWQGTPPPGYYWGHGGAEQLRVIADFNGTNYFPGYIYAYGNRYHDQPIGLQALSYKPLAGNGNALSVATYLDGFNPTTYSDIYNVYTNLDYLNWNNPSLNTNQAEYTRFFRQALRSISPDRYEALLFLAMRSALLVDNAILEQHLHTCHCNKNSCDDTTCCFKPNGLWIYGIGERGNFKKNYYPTGFDYYTAGIACCADWQPCNNLIVGIGAAGLRESLTWHHGGGKAHGGNAKLSVYIHYAPSCFFIDGIVSGGWRWTSARRSIVFNAIDSFTGLNRWAYSHQKGRDFEVHMQTGFDFVNEWWSIIPLARLSYFSNKQKKFKEHGADSLDLNVNGFKADTLRAYVGTELEYSFETACVCIMPNIHAAWARDIALNNRTITASLNAIGGSFSVDGVQILGNRAIVGAGLDILCTNGIITFVRYDGEFRKHFIAHALKLGLTLPF